MEFHKGVVTIGIVRDVDKYVQKLNMRVSYMVYTSYLNFTRHFGFRPLHVVEGK